MRIKDNGQRGFVTPVTNTFKTPANICAYTGGKFITKPKTQVRVVHKPVEVHDVEYQIMLASKSCRKAGRSVSWIGPWAFDWAWA